MLRISLLNPREVDLSFISREQQMDDRQAEERLVTVADAAQGTSMVEIASKARGDGDHRSSAWRSYICCSRLTNGRSTYRGSNKEMLSKRAPSLYKF